MENVHGMPLSIPRVPTLTFIALWLSSYCNFQLMYQRIWVSNFRILQCRDSKDFFCFDEIAGFLSWKSSLEAGLLSPAENISNFLDGQCWLGYFLKWLIDGGNQQLPTVPLLLWLSLRWRDPVHWNCLCHLHHWQSCRLLRCRTSHRLSR